jgi:penicillin amidase
MLAEQTSIYSEVDQQMAHRVAYALEHAHDSDPRIRQAATVLRDWDGRLTEDSAAASLLVSLRPVLWSMLLEPKLGKDASFYHWGEENFALEEIVMRNNPNWLPAGYRNWDALLLEATRRAMEEGKAPANIHRWRYGNWHEIDLKHPLVAFLPSFLHLAGTGAQPLTGDPTTVKQVRHNFGPSQRFILDWSNIDDARENVVLGESGNPLSPYFMDQWPEYYNGRSIALPFTASIVSAHAQHRLLLR